jgi:Methyltransferase domain
MQSAIDSKRVLEIQRGIPGSLLEESAATWCVLLQAQHAACSRQGSLSGDYLEIGVLHGKSASVLASFSNEYGNTLTIVDPEVRQETKRILDALSPRVHYIESVSELLPQTEFYAKNRRRLAFAHIDGMHRFSAVISDLQVCETMLADFGIVSVDDFHTDLFPQIPAAVYKCLYSGVSDLCMFLVGLNKAYLCRNIAKKYYREFAGTHLLPSLEKLGYKLTLVKTDRNDSFDAFGIAGFWESRLYGSEHI